MTVLELINFLSKLDPNRIIVISKDGEGNSYSPLANFSTAAYKADTTWSGEIGLEELPDDLKALGYSEADLVTNGTPCVVLWPAN